MVLKDSGRLETPVGQMSLLGALLGDVASVEIGLARDGLRPATASALITGDVEGAPPEHAGPPSADRPQALRAAHCLDEHRVVGIAPAGRRRPRPDRGCAPVNDPADPAAQPPGSTCAPGRLPTLAAGTLTIGTDQPVFPPWYLDDDPTSGRGFESAVAYAIAGELGYPRDAVTWTRVPFNAAIQPGPKTFDLDLTEFSVTDERRQAVDFSAPYYDVKQVVVTLGAGPVAGATTLAQLKEARIGAQVGTTSYTAIVEQIAPTTEPAVFNTNDDAKLALMNGQVDAIVVDLPTAFFITSAELDDGRIVGQLAPGGGAAEQFGAVLDKGSALTGCVSEAVERLRSNGTLAALEREWLASAGTAPELR